MDPNLDQLRRLVEKSFPKISNFHEKVSVNFEILENAKSFWSEIYVAHLKANDDSEDVPENVFIKVPKISENVLRCEDEEAVHELQNVLVYYSKKENLFYKHFPYGSIPNFPFPKIYYTENVEEDGTGGLVAENLSEKVYAVEHIPGLNHEQVLRLMEALAGFHSHLIQRNDKSYVDSFVEGAHGREAYSPGMQNMMFEEALTLETVCPHIFGNGRIQKIKWSFDYEIKNKTTKKAIAEIPGIICHADLNVTNILWKKESPIHEIGAIIDYQMMFIGSIAFDIIRVLTLGLSQKNRRENGQMYMEHYHKTLSGFFNGLAPFSIEQLKNQYFLIYPFASNFTLFGIAIYINMYSDGTLGSPEMKQFNCEELLDRARGIVEDIEALRDNYH